MQATSNPGTGAQVNSSSPSIRNPKRKLDHLADLADGYDQWDMIPRRLSRAYLDGKFPEAKFRLLLCMMSHSGGFHVKRNYLEERFSPNTLAKYLSELKLGGYIDVEQLRNNAGRLINVYHVRALSDWALYRQNVDPIVSEARPFVDPIVSEAIAREDHKDFNSKDFKEDLNRTTLHAPARMNLDIEPERQGKADPQEAKQEPEDNTKPRYGSDAHKLLTSDLIKHGKAEGLFVVPDDLSRFIALACQNLGASESMIRSLWPIAVAGMLESKERNPAKCFFNWIKREIDAQERARQNAKRKPGTARPKPATAVSVFDPKAELAKLLESQND